MRFNQRYAHCHQVLSAPTLGFPDVKGCTLSSREPALVHSLGTIVYTAAIDPPGENSSHVLRDDGEGHAKSQSFKTFLSLHACLWHARETLLEIAAYGPAAGAAVSLGLLVIGLALSAAGIGGIEFEPSAFRDSFLVGILGKPTRVNPFILMLRSFMSHIHY
jgi:hypothetical protein